ncbi:glycoside hydrolase family 127 protein [Kibdelosporangium aridum]|nr:beta-L-arabinofuranosidase domain-containing protein [Kibdelosporangium aridum]
MPQPMACPVLPTTSALRPIVIDDVRLTGGFWGKRQERNADRTIAHCLTWARRAGWLANFTAAIDGTLPAARRGREFSDADVYKVAEAMAWEVGRSGNVRLDKEILDFGELLAAAQHPDGYLNTKFDAARYTDLEWGHELYCYGHLIQAGVARLRTAGEDDLTAVAIRAADHVCAEFGPGGRERVCGHPEIEMALVELYRATGEHRYLEQARLFVDRRGTRTLADIEFGRQYFQDDVPIKQADVLHGHAVRALYLACGAVDVAVETGDDELLWAVARQWEQTLASRTYITGGMGSRHQDEAFGEAFELAPDRAYAETCAAIASVMLSWRLLLATGEARFADLIERTLFNAVAVSPDEHGTSFFYRNTLHQRRLPDVPVTDSVSPRAAAGMRAPWYDVSCCPTNIARTLTSLGGYVATTDVEGVQLHQFMAAEIKTDVADLHVQTDYPHDGKVTVHVLRTVSREWTLSIRIPSWAVDAAISTADSRQTVGPGYTKVRRQWQAGDQVVLELPMAARWTWPDPRIDAVRGCVAAERGPLVYCLESVDQPDADLDTLAVLTSQPPEPSGGFTLTAPARWSRLPDRSWPYGSAITPAELASTAVFVPYHLWGNRGPSTMRVFVPEHPPQ